MGNKTYKSSKWVLSVGPKIPSKNKTLPVVINKNLIIVILFIPKLLRFV